MTNIVPSRIRPNILDVYRGGDDWFRRALQEFGGFDLTREFGLDITPRVDVSEDEKNITVKAEMPGLDAKDLDISLENDYLTIKAEKREEKEEKNVHYHMTERRYGGFCRSLRLPTEVKTDKIEAFYRNGILTVVLPKVEESKPAVTHVKVH